MSTKATKLQKKIELLRALIDHARTGEGERDAARHMLQRLLSKAAQPVEEGGEEKAEPTWYSDNRAYGVKYESTKRMTTVEIAKLIRAEIKLAQKLAKSMAEPGDLKTPDPIGDAPAEIKFSVVSEYFSGGSSIDISIKNIPDSWGWEDREDRYGYMTNMPTTALKILADELKSISDAYNYDGSDISTDHFDVRFYSTVYGGGGRVLA
jgi:hypothetical protein